MAVLAGRILVSDLGCSMAGRAPFRSRFGCSRLLASLAAAMASSSKGCPPPPAASQEVRPPPAASQGLSLQVAAECDDAGIFWPIRVATYNVGAAQADAFKSTAKMGGFKAKLVVSSNGETGGRAGIHHPKGPPRGRAHPSGGARPRAGSRRGPSGGG